MDAYFRDLSQALFKGLHGREEALLAFHGEDSDFVRFNRNAIRQAGHVRQQTLDMTLIQGDCQASATLNLSGRLEADVDQAGATLAALRAQLPLLPDDPYLHYATEPRDTFAQADNALPSATDAVGEIIAAARDLDLVGLWASGEMAQGFANSLGQFNWHSSRSFNFDWSIYQHDDKAIKQSYAGFDWSSEQLQQRIASARATLPLLAEPARTIEPGRYRVYLTPAALHELMELLNWGAFGLKSHRTAQTPLLQMVRDQRNLDPRIHMTERHAAGLTAPFTHAGFIKPERVDLIVDGAYRDCLANARSAKEYGADVNCSIEHPQSLGLAPGDLPEEDILGALDTGVWISNLWYCNYSDRNHCRITGMTRFACLWVENGEVVAPLNVMRFDETLYNILGTKLIGLTDTPEHILDSSTYGQRSAASTRLPGALVDDFCFTL